VIERKRSALKLNSRFSRYAPGMRGEINAEAVRFDPRAGRKWFTSRNPFQRAGLAGSSKWISRRVNKYNKCSVEKALMIRPSRVGTQCLLED